MSAISAFYITPSMSALGRSFDFLPASAAARERSAYAELEIWHGVLIILQLIVAFILAGRFLFDFYEFRAGLSSSHRRRHRRRRYRTVMPSPGSHSAAQPHSPQPPEAGTASN
jgi:hypothetical protein